MVPIFDHIDREQAQLYSLILNAVGIGNRVVSTGGGFSIEVPCPLKEKALETIDRYHDENPESDVGNIETGLSNLTNAPLSGIFVAFLLLAVHLAVTTSSAPASLIFLTSPKKKPTMPILSPAEIDSSPSESVASSIAKLVSRITC